MRWLRLRAAGLQRRFLRPILDASYRARFRHLVLEIPDGARFVFTEVELPSLEQLPDEARESAERILSEAALILRHEMRFVSDRNHDYGDPIAWKRDSVTGKVWPDHFHRDLEVVDLSEPSDPIRVWELSRGHQLLTLARASRLAPDRSGEYLAELADQLDAWIAENPVGFGVNWSNAMEAAIRATNWIWAIAIAGPGNIPAATLQRATRSLQQHGRFIRRNLEGSWLRRGNHYLADLMGMAAIGAAIRGDRTLARSARFTARRIGPQVARQFRGDGGNFEGSGPYQGLTLEMLAITVLCLERQGLAPPAEMRDELEGILDFAVAIRHPNGRTAQYGDSDSGRILPAGFDRPPTHDPVIWLAASILGSGRPLPGSPDPEIAWTLGLDAWKEMALRSEAAPRRRNDFPETGIYVLEGGGTKIVVTCGPIEKHGTGVHAHSDALSFEASIEGIPLIVDPGTISYWGDPAARNEMRSTSAHSTPQVDEVEIATFRPEWIFRIDEVSRPFVRRFDETEDSVILECGHDAFCRLGDPVRIRRRFVLDLLNGKLDITDRLEGRGFHSLSLTLPLLPGAGVRQTDPDRMLIEVESVEVEVTAEGAVLSAAQGPYSDGYGLEESAPRVMARWEGEIPHAVCLSISAAS